MAGGTLKLKGDDGSKKKKKSSVNKDSSVVKASGSKFDSPDPETTYIPRSNKTDAERRFEETQRKRLAEKAAKEATKSHKDRVAEFNEKLEKMSEHYDIPKVGPG